MIRLPPSSRRPHSVEDAVSIQAGADVEHRHGLKGVSGELLMETSVLDMRPRLVDR